MALQVWLPLNGNLNNQGLADIQFNNTSVTVDNNGKIGQCYYFNGSAYLYENTYNWTNFNPNEFSLCCWYNQPSIASGNSQMICIGTNSGWNNIRIGLLRRTSNGYPMFSVSDGSTAIQYNFTATTFPLNKWTHIAVTYNNGKLKMYLNGQLDKEMTTTIVPALNSSQHLGIGAASNGAEKLLGYLNDVRIYDHALSDKEVQEIAKGLILHYKLDNKGTSNGNPNLGKTSTNYSNMIIGHEYSAGGWGGDAGTVTYYSTGGYNNLPYKVYHKTATGTGGIYKKTADDITIESGKTYTMSCWIKASRAFTENAYAFNINRGVGNQYINYGASIAITTDWQFLSKTFTATDDLAGSYGEMSIIYNDDVVDYYVYYSGFKLEEGSIATSWTEPNATDTSIIYDSSGYGHNATINGAISLSNNSSRFSNCVYVPNGATDYILTDNAIVLPSDAITMCYWFKSSNTSPGSSYHMPFNSYTGTDTYEMSIHSTGYLRGGLRINGTRYVDNCTSKKLVNGEWHHCAMTYDGTTIKRYVDGVMEKSTSITGTLNTSQKFILGHYGTNTAYCCKEAYISDARLYATALTEEQILELYHTGASIDNYGNIYARELVEI